MGLKSETPCVAASEKIGAQYKSLMCEVLATVVEDIDFSETYFKHNGFKIPAFKHNSKTKASRALENVKDACMFLFNNKPEYKRHRSVVFGMAGIDITPFRQRIANRYPNTYKAYLSGVI